MVDQGLPQSRGLAGTHSCSCCKGWDPADVSFCSNTAQILCRHERAPGAASQKDWGRTAQLPAPRTLLCRGVPALLGSPPGRSPANPSQHLPGVWTVRSACLPVLLLSCKKPKRPGSWRERRSGPGSAGHLCAPFLSPPLNEE